MKVKARSHCAPTAKSGCSGRRLRIEAAWAVALVFAATANAHAQTGACCRSNGTCSMTDPAECASSGGDFLGTGVPCVAFLCRGGCCRPSGECSLNIPRLNCEINGGTYRGHSSDCAGAECPVLPNGACCREPSCQEGFTETACDGVWPGDGSTCDDCPGACCLTDDSCIPSTRGECGSIEGATFPRNLSDCPIDGCGEGACCFASVDPKGDCGGPIDPFDCAASQGRYQGHGSDCATATCPRFGGGCCCGGFSCFVSTGEECASFGCTFLGEGIACGPESRCPGDGACCPGDGGPCNVTDAYSCVSSGGTYSSAGTTCTPDPCTADFCIYRVACLSGDCTGCAVTAGRRECKDVACPAGTCAGSLKTKCPNADSECCVELELVDCRPPADEPSCPEFVAECTCDRSPGACCLADGGCAVTDEVDCVGTYMGDDTSCEPVQSCCDINLGCSDRAAVCCEADGLESSVGRCGALTGKCCESDGACVEDTNETCCDTSIIPGKACASFDACCLGSGDCVDMDPDCCAILGGTALPGESCTSPRACCAPEGCVARDPLCCDAFDGIVSGEDECAPAEACCFAEIDPLFLIPIGADCINEDPTCCSEFGGTPDGPDLCREEEACCFLDRSCSAADPSCCEDAGGSTAFGEACDAPTACCFPDDFCETLAPACCTEFGGTPITSAVLAGGRSCSRPEACCTVFGCIELDPVCCDFIGGIATGKDECAGVEACCSPEGDCFLEEPDCCEAIGGTPLGPGSECLGDGKVPDGVDNACQQACCHPDDTCEDMLPTVCKQGGGEAGGLGTRCLDDENADGADDFCRTPGDANGDGTLDCNDLAIFVMCLEDSGPDRPPPAKSDCRHANANDDITINLRDFAELQVRLIGGCQRGP